MLWTMKKQLFSFLILILFATALSAQATKQAVQKPDLAEQNLKRHVGYLASDKLEGRRTGEQGAISAGGYVANMFANYKLRPGVRQTVGGKTIAKYLQPFPYVTGTAPAKKSTEAYNVIGVLEGTDPVLKNEAVVIGAHYDHLGKGGAGSITPDSTEIHHGADDNASGTAALIELARQFSGLKNNKRTLIFIAFSGEEEGLLGSRFYVNNPVFPLAKTIAMINLDMIGRLNEGKLTIDGTGTAREWSELVKRKNEILFDSENGYGVAKKLNLQLNEDGFGPGDHSSFYGKQIPVLFFFTGTHNDYHKPTDTADKINYEGLKQITSYVADIVKAIDQNPIKPTARK